MVKIHPADRDEAEQMLKSLFVPIQTSIWLIKTGNNDEG